MEAKEVFHNIYDGQFTAPALQGQNCIYNTWGKSKKLSKTWAQIASCVVNLDKSVMCTPECTEGRSNLTFVFLILILNQRGHSMCVYNIPRRSMCLSSHSK